MRTPEQLQRRKVQRKVRRQLAAHPVVKAPDPLQNGVDYLGSLLITKRQEGLPR